MSYKILSLSNKQEWKDYLNKLPLEQQDVYYTPEYYSLYENYGDGKAECFVFEKDGEIALYPFLINSINKLGYELDKEYYDIQGAYGYNGVVSSSYNSDFIESFYNAFQKYCNENNIIVEFSRFHPLLENQLFSSSHLNVIFDRPTVYINVNKPEKELWSDLQKTTRKQINRCYKRYQVKVELFEKNEFDLNTFTNVYWESMKRVESNKYLFFNEKYFKQLLNQPNTIQYIASIDDIPISTIIAIKGKRILHGHLGGTIKEYLNISPFSMLYWEMIKTAKKESLDFVHVGGGNTTKKDDKLLSFKKHFSNLQEDFFIGKKIYNQIIYDEIINQWKIKHTKSYKNNSKKILGYRYLMNYE
jgi:lipid II:glycine glycyltransferase (peptidoglycan interpeptide bridge formation enzyme)